MRKLVDRVAAELGARSLSFQLGLLALVTAIPLLLLTFLMFQQMVNQDRESIRRGLLTNARTLAGLVDNEIKVHAAIASTLATSPALLDGNFPEFWREARKALEFVPGAWITVATADGAIRLASQLELGTALPRHAAPELIARAFATGQYQVSNILVSASTQKLTTLVIVPVFRDGKPLYCLSIAVPPESFLRLMSRQYSDNYIAAIIDQNHKFVARIPEHTDRVGTLAAPGWREAISKLREGWSENISVEGKWILTGYVPTTYGWTVGVAELQDELNKPINRILWSLATVGSLLVLSSLALAWWLAARSGRSMTSLALAARAVGDGAPVQPLTQAPFLEAGIIAESLSTASRELHKRGEELARINSRLENEVAERTSDLVAEMRRREEIEGTLRQTQKMEAIGQLTGGIAHDFNNMLTIVIGNLDTLQRRLRSVEPTVSASLLKPVESAMKGARNAAKLTHRLLAFARQQPLAPKPLDIRSLIAGMSDMLARMAGETVSIETVSGAGLWPILADENQLENALLNLVVNARDAMPNGGQITIETSNSYLDDVYVEHLGDIKAGQYVMLSVSDTGTGIPADKIDKIFEPFFTTKPAGQGTGLGLAMIHGFVKQSGGHIRIYSEQGQGTTVKIYLPRMQTAELPSPETTERKRHLPQAVAGETVLLVEDDEGVREYAVGILQDAGYNVVPVGDGQTALRVLSGPERVDVLFTDVVLGGELNGRQVAEEAKKIRPRLPVLFTTGYTRNAIVHHGRLDAGVNLLNKPYTSHELTDSVRRLIDRSTLLAEEESLDERP